MVSKKTGGFVCWCAAAALGLAGVAGCEAPDQVVPAAPPGVDLRSTFQPKEEPAEAKGEQPVQSGGEAKSVRVTTDVPPALPTAKGEVKKTPSGVEYTTVKEGTGATVKAGQRVVVHYTGKLIDGRKFDSSRDKGMPATFSIGTEDVIKGWDEAVPGMKIGEIREMTIPPNAGYGATGKGPIPPNATLKFEIELIDIQ